MTNNSLSSLSDEVLTARLGELSKRDLKLTAEIVVHIHEFMVRRLYLDHGCTSIFSYLTDKLGYPRATAQNRYDAARLLHVAPEIESDLASGQISLAQITLMSMGIREAEKQSPGLKVSDGQKRDLIEKLKTVKASEFESAQTVAKELAIEIRPTEKVRVHRDGSVTIQVHLSQEEFKSLKRVRELNSHKKNSSKFGEAVAEAAKFFLEKKDPLKLPTKIVAPVLKNVENDRKADGSKLNTTTITNLNGSSNSNSRIESNQYGGFAPKRTSRKLPKRGYCSRHSPA